MSAGSPNFTERNGLIIKSPYHNLKMNLGSFCDIHGN